MTSEKRMLIIDDELDLCFLLKDYFTRRQYDVYVYHTLEEGMRALEEVKPEIILLDNNLPDGTGWSIAPDIAKSHPEIYMVLLSAFHPEVPDMPAGAKFQIIEKPIKLSDLDSQFAPAIA